MSMYRGNNPTALTSQTMLLESLNELLKTKEFKDISISELCEHSTISRQTFYSLFGTKENILLYYLENAPYAKEHQYNLDIVITLTEMCRRHGIYVATNYTQLKMLVDNNLVSIIAELYRSTMSSCQQLFSALNAEETEYAALFASSGLASLTEKYINTHETPDADEIASLTYKIMSGSIFKLK